MTTIISSSAGAVWIALGGIAAVLVVSAAFYVIGRGEDRDRADAERRATADEPDQAEPAEPSRSKLPPSA